jgi:hypothetical protein
VRGVGQVLNVTRRFIYYVAKAASIPWVYGGEYQEYANIVTGIVEAWMSVGVVPIFVFDGG